MEKRFFIMMLLVSATICIMAQSVVKPATVRLETTMGAIVVKLYPETEKHRDNFLKLVNQGFYDGVLFHRVIANFMIQTGDPKSKNADPDAMLGGGGTGYTVPAEFIYPKYFHKKGALAAARLGDQNNPQRASSGCQFYIVKGKIFNDHQLDSLEKVRERKLLNRFAQEITQNRQAEINKLVKDKNQVKLTELNNALKAEVLKKMQQVRYTFTPEQRQTYKTIGGTPHLDGEYSVFGEVTEGIEIVDRISETPTGKADRPITDVKILKATAL